MFHSGTPAKIHFLSAVSTVQHSRQRTHFAHIGRTTFVLAYFLNGVKSLLVYDCFLRILEDDPISSRLVYAFSRLVRLFIGLKICRTARVFYPRQHTHNRFRRPDFLPETYRVSCRQAVFPIIDNRRIVTLFREYTRYLCRTVSLYAQLECFFYYFGGFIVDYPLILIFRRFNVTEGRECSQMLARITFCLKYGFDFLTAIFGVHFVENVFERCNIVIGIGFAVHLVVDCYKPHVGFGKIIFRVVAYKNVIPAEPRHIFDDNGRYFPVVHVVHHTLEVGAVKVASRIPVVHIKLYVSQTVFVRILL